MAQSFSNQILSILYIIKNHKKIGNKVITVPNEIDTQIAIDALKAFDVKIDSLNKKQLAYRENW
jgi:adenosylhomocysteinase